MQLKWVKVVINIWELKDTYGSEWSPEHHAPNVHDGNRHVYPSFNPRNYRSPFPATTFGNPFQNPLFFLIQCNDAKNTLPAEIIVAAQSSLDCKWRVNAPAKNTIRRNRKYYRTEGYQWMKIVIRTLYYKCSWWRPACVSFLQSTQLQITVPPKRLLAIPLSIHQFSWI